METPPLGSRTIVVAVVSVVIGLLGIVAALGSTPSGPVVTPADEESITVLREQINQVRGERESLPSAGDLDRNLVRSWEAALSVARLQNDYRRLSREVEDGRLDPALTEATRRMLTPHFDPAVPASVLSPWYLLASDVDVSTGVGIPETFDSGFEWQVQPPLVMGSGGTIPVLWLAVETDSGDRPGEVLAWARADYDMTRQVFTDVYVASTAFGRELGLTVKG